jgi:gamma-glutamyltranspeptidase/glutathione hydrolase
LGQSRPGRADSRFGRVGFEANLPGPGKRPLSSMSPTIVLKVGKPMLITGSPGGSKGHRVGEPMGLTSANSIAVTADGLFGAPDPRTRGSEAAGNQLVNPKKRACMPIDQ